MGLGHGHRERRFQEGVIPPSGWLIVLSPLIAAFFYAPLAFGCVTPSTVAVLDQLLALSFVLWAGLLIFERRLPRLSLICCGSLIFLTALGTCDALNPLSIFHAETWSFSPLAEAVTWLPGTVDQAASAPVLRHMGALLLGGLVLQDAVAGSRPRWLLFRTVAIAGLVIAVIGMEQKASGAAAMLWSTPERSGTHFFAAFRYHGNAASFLNLSWPAALAVALRSRLIRPGGIVASIDLAVVFFVLAAVFVNTSKAGQILGLTGAFIGIWHFRSQIFEQNIPRSTAVLTGLLFMGAFAVLVLPGLVSSIANWSSFIDKGDTLHGRLLAYGACLRALPETGIFGTGPGTFRLVFPFYTNHLGNRIAGIWIHAHQDWLQGLIEWGYTGLAAWAVLYTGAFVRLWRRIRHARDKGVLEITASISLLGLALVLVHSVGDFPLQIPAIQWLVVFYLAVAWSNPHERHSHSHTTAHEAS